MLTLASLRAHRRAALVIALAALAAPLPAFGQAPPAAQPPPAPAPPAPPAPPPAPPSPPASPPPGFVQPPPSPLPPPGYGQPFQPPPGYGRYGQPPMQPAPVYGQPIWVPVAPPQAPDAAKGQIDGGFVLEASVGARVSLGSVGSNSGSVTFGNPGIAAGLMAGFKTGRLILGLDLDFFNVTASASNGGSGSESALLIGPHVQVALARSEDLRVELLGDAAIDFGHLFSSGDLAGSGGSNLYVGYQLGLGVRYWLHRQFAVQGLTGFGGEALVDLSGNGETISAHGIFTSIGLVGVF